MPCFLLYFAVFFALSLSALTVIAIRDNKIYGNLGKTIVYYVQKGNRLWTAMTLI